MALARLERVKKLVGSPSNQQSEKLNIEQAIEDADQIVEEYTKKDTWTEGVDNGYSWAQDAAEKWAAHRILEEFGDMNTSAERLRKEAMEDLEVLRKIGYGEVGADNPLFYSAVATAKTIGYNPNAPRYVSRNAFGGQYD